MELTSVLEVLCTVISVGRDSSVARKPVHVQQPKFRFAIVKGSLIVRNLARDTNSRISFLVNCLDCKFTFFRVIFANYRL